MDYNNGKFSQVTLLCSDFLLDRFHWFYQTGTHTVFGLNALIVANNFFDNFFSLKHDQPYLHHHFLHCHQFSLSKFSN